MQAAALADSKITADNVKLQNFMDSFAGVFLASHTPGSDIQMREHFARACADLPSKLKPDACQLVQERCKTTGCNARFDELRVQPMPEHLLALQRKGVELPAISSPPPGIPTASTAGAPGAPAGSAASAPEHGSHAAVSHSPQATGAQRSGKGKRQGGKRSKRRVGQPVDTNIMD